MIGQSAAVRDPPLLRSVALVRDIAIALAGTAIAVTQARAANWALVAGSLASALVWVVSARIERNPDRQQVFAQTAFIAMGVVAAVRVSQSWLFLNVAAIWLLICGIDLHRLVVRFPAGSPPLRRRRLVRRRLMHLVGLGGASAAVVLAARLLVVPLRLSAVILVSAFVVVVIARTVREAATDRGTDSRSAADGPSAPGGAEDAMPGARG